MGLRGPKGEQTENVALMGLVIKERPKPPRWLPKLARDWWKQTVFSLPVEHFRVSDLPLLEQGAIAYAKWRQALEQSLKVNLAAITDKGYGLENVYDQIVRNWEKEYRQIATKLRITPNSRITKFQAASEKEEPPRKRKGLMFGGK